MVVRFAEVYSRFGAPFHMKGPPMTDAERIASKLNAVPADIPGLWRVPVGPFNHPEMTTAQMFDYARRAVLEGEG